MIVRAWRQPPETDRIHYVVECADGSERRLTAEPDEPLHPILASYLNPVDRVQHD